MNTVQELMNKFDGIKTDYAKLFPNNFVSFSRPCLGRNNFYVHLLLQHPKDCYNGIEQNDPMMTMFNITQIGDDNFVVELINGESLYVNPVDRMLAMSRVKCAFRKTTGNHAKVLAAMNKYFAKRKDCINTNRENIYGLNRIDVKYFA